MSTNYIDQITDTAGTTHDISEGDSTRIFRATCTTAASTTAKVATLQTSSRNFSLATGVRVAVTFTYGNSATTPTLRVDGSSTGTAKTIAVATSATAKATGNGTTYNTWGPYETVLFTYDGTYWVNGGSSRSIYNAYNQAASAGTGTVTSVGLANATNGGLTISDSPITTSGTINVGHTNILTNAQTTQAVYPIAIDKNGHISSYGNAVTIPTVPGIATNITAGLVKPWYYWQQSSTGPTAGTVNSSATVNARSATAGRYYPIEIDKDGRMFVNVPWTNVNSDYITTDTNTTYTLSGALSSHKLTSTLTPSSGNATTSDFTLAAGTGITITDTTSSRTMTIACTVTNTDTKVTEAYSTSNSSYPILMTATAGISSTSSRGATTSILNNQIYANPSTGTISATYFNGAAAATTAYTTANLKNIIESDSAPGSTTAPNGTVWLQYGTTWIDDAADYVVEHGTSGIWTYRKWNSGIAECWGRTAAATYSHTSTSGYAYYTGSSVSLPSGLFTTVTCGFAERAQGTGSSPSNTLITVNVNNLTTTTLGVFVQSASQGSQSITISCRVVGTWK